MKLFSPRFVLVVVGLLLLVSLFVWKYTNGFTGSSKVSIAHSVANSDNSKLVNTKISPNLVNTFAQKISLDTKHINVEIVDTPQQDFKYSWGPKVASSVGYAKNGDVDIIKIYFDPAQVDQTSDLSSVLTYQLARALIKLKNPKINNQDASDRAVDLLKSQNLNGKLIY